MAEAGRPSLLTDELLLKIRESILAGNNLKETANLCGIEPETIYDWNYKNYRDLSTLIDTWVAERRLMKAEKKIEQLIDAEDEKVALNASTFIAETIGKKRYSKKTETELSGNLNIYKWDGYQDNNEIRQDNAT